MSEKREAKLKCFGIVQQLNESYFEWSQTELIHVRNKNRLGIAKVIVDRLNGGGVEVSDFHIIIHDKDIREIWSDVEGKMIQELKPIHFHVACRLKNKHETPLSRIAELVGVKPQYVEKVSRGRYGWDNMLAYLIHIKYPDKHQYHYKEVFTYAGKSYSEIYSERRKDWMKGRASVVREKAKVDIDWLEEMILSGEVTYNQILLTDEYFHIYSKYKRRCDEAVECYVNRKILKAVVALQSGEFKVSCLYIMGDSGSGKTSLANAIIGTISTSQGWDVYKGASTNSMDDYAGQEIVLLDDVRGTAMRADDWLKLLDPYNVTQSSARYKNKVVPARLFVITATMRPAEFFFYAKGVGRGDAQAEAVDQFIRRLTAVLQVIDAKNFKIDCKVPQLSNKPVTTNIPSGRNLWGDQEIVIPVVHNYDFVDRPIATPFELMDFLSDELDIKINRADVVKVFNSNPVYSMSNQTQVPNQNTKQHPNKTSIPGRPHKKLGRV